jgi:hypothetical protein
MGRRARVELGESPLKAIFPPADMPAVTRDYVADQEKVHAAGTAM